MQVGYNLGFYPVWVKKNITDSDSFTRANHRFIFIIKKGTGNNKKNSAKWKLRCG